MRQKYTFIVSLILVWLIIPTSLFAQTIQIGEITYNSLEEAIEAANASPGSHITIESTETIEISDELLITESVTLEGIGTPVTLKAVKLDPMEPHHRLFRIQTTAGSEITFTNLIMEGNLSTPQEIETDFMGGILYLINQEFEEKDLYATLLLNNTTFTGAQAYYGGAIATDYTGGWDVRITNGTFTYNEAQISGGALYLQNSQLTFIGGTVDFNKAGFLDNYRVNGYGGGAIYVNIGSWLSNFEEIIFENVSFNNNRSLARQTEIATGGGAVFIENAPVSIRNSSFSKNIAGLIDQEKGIFAPLEGGALFFTSYQVDGMEYFIENVTFEENISFGMGGAGFLEGKNTTLKEVIFTGNVAWMGGGAIYARHLGSEELEKPVFSLEKNQFYRNKTESREDSFGGAINMDFKYYRYNNDSQNTPFEVVIKDNHFEDNLAYSGGAIYANLEMTQISITDNTKFINNISHSDGGACKIEIKMQTPNTSSIIDQVEFRGNHLIPLERAIPNLADNIWLTPHVGGALSLNTYNHNIEINHSIFENNYIESDLERISGQGGAIYYSEYIMESRSLNAPSTLFINSSDFKDNHISLTGQNVEAAGGAIQQTTGMLKISGKKDRYVHFENNYVQVDHLRPGENFSYSSYPPSETGGGAVMVTDAPVFIDHTLFKGNWLTVNCNENYRNGGGGGLRLEGCNYAQLMKTTFENNEVNITAENIYEAGGGAICSSHGWIDVLESTLAHNIAKITSTDGIVSASGGGALFSFSEYNLSLVNSTITRNNTEVTGTTIPTYEYESQSVYNYNGGGGILFASYKGAVLNSILTGNFIKEENLNRIEDWFTPDLPMWEMDHRDRVTMAYCIYEKLNDLLFPDLEQFGNHTADIQNVFGGEPVIQKYTIPIKISGKAAPNGTFVAFNYHEESDMPIFNFVHEGSWYIPTFYGADPPFEVEPFDPLDISGNYGLHISDIPNHFGDIKGPLIMAQNEVDRLAFNHEIYNVGAHALQPQPGPGPEPDPEATLQWSVSTTNRDSFKDVENGQTTTITEPANVYLQIRPVADEELKFDSWTIEYSVDPDSCYYPVETNIAANSRYNFKEGTPHQTIRSYVYTVTSLTLYLAGNKVGTFNFRESPYIHTITIKEDDSEEPEPTWPPILPEDPENPDPNPDRWIVLQPLAPFCDLDQYILVVFETIEKNKNLEYAIAFTEESKAAGFTDIDKYNPLPTNGTIEIPVNRLVQKGIYYGYIVVREKGQKKHLNFYPFKINLVGYIEIIEQPVSHTNFCENDVFELQVKATGEVLSYQWYHQDQKIAGANENIYRGQVTEETVGDYFAVVTGYCNADTSRIATVGMSTLRILRKWDDMLLLTNTDGRFIKYQWFKNGQPVTVYGNSIYYTEEGGFHGSYFVRAYTSADEYIESCPIDFTVETRASILSIYPNPVDKGTYIHIESDEKGESCHGATIELFNLYGQKVYTTVAKTSSIHIPVNVSEGIYVLKVLYTSGNVKTEKIIVQ